MERTEFLDAVIDKDIKKVKRLIKGGININQSDRNGWDALHFAAQNNDVEIGRLLIDNGINIENKDKYGNTPLLRATFASKGYGGFIKMLLDEGADRDIKNNNGVSPLILAERIGNYDVKQFF